MKRPPIATAAVLMQYGIAAGLIATAVVEPSTLAAPALIAVVVAIALRLRTAWSWRLALIADALGFLWLGFTMTVNRESNPIKGSSVWLMAITAMLLLVPEARRYFAGSRPASGSIRNPNGRS